MEIIKLLDNKIKAYDHTSVALVDGLEFSIKEIIKTIEYYTNSRYLSGMQDHRGKDKPFYNIVNYRVNVAMRATDLDTKDIKIIADEPQFQGLSFLLDKEVYNWMKEANFGKTLNEMSYVRPKYGGVLVKKCIEIEEDGKEELEIEVVDWRNVVIDQSDIDDVIIERHYMSAEDLSEKMDVWDNVKEAMDEAMGCDDGKLEVYEIRGNLPESYSPDGGDRYTYKQQVFFVTKKNKKTDAMVLFHDFVDEFIYKYLSWENIPGRSLGRGVVEDGFQAQEWTNDSVIREKEVMEIGSKLIFKTTDNTIQNNVLTEVDNGDIIKLTSGDISPINTLTGNLPQFQNLIEKWNTQYERVTNTFAAVTGETMPSNTPFRTTAILNNEAGSFFDFRREEMGIFITEIFNEWVIPYLVKKINKAHILSSEFTPDELNMIDDLFNKYTVNQKTVDNILEGKVQYQSDYETALKAHKELIKNDSSKRFLDVPKNFFKGFKAKVTVVTTGEQRNKGVIMETLNNILLTVAKAPNVLTDPALNKIFTRIIEMSGAGISPLQLMAQANDQQIVQQEQPVPGQPPEMAGVPNVPEPNPAME